MKLLLPVLIVAALSGSVTSCTKSKAPAPEGTPPVTAAIQSGKWMINTYIDNGTNISLSFGLSMITFNNDGTLSVTKDASSYSGTCSETKTSTTNTFTINITTADTKLQKVNGTWKVTSVTPYFIDLKDGNASGSAALDLMKH